MKNSALSLCAVLALAATSPALADSQSVAAAFAAATPTRYTGLATFDARSGNVSRAYEYRFALDRDFHVVSLTVNGVPVAIPGDQPLDSLPYPIVGTVEGFNLTLQAWDEWSPAQPSSQPSAVSSLTIIGDGTETAATAPETSSAVELAGFKVKSDSSDVSVSPVTVSATSSSSARAAGTGYASYETLHRGDSVEVWLYAADLVRFLPVPEIGTSGAAGWSLSVSGGSASGPVLVNGQWGFWVFLNPTTLWGYDYWLTGPGGYTGWGPLDPDSPAESGNGVGLAVHHDSGVGVIDLRQRWPQWARLSGIIDGAFTAGEGWNTQYSHTGEAVAVRTEDYAFGLNVFYAGVAATVLVRELDESGAQTMDSDGKPREWLISSGAQYFGERESSLSGYVPLQTGRAVIVITPAKDSSRFGAYDLLVESAGYYGKGS